MPSPFIPLEVLLEPRRLLDSIQAAQTKSEPTFPAPKAARTEATTPAALLARARRRSPEAEESKDELASFQ
jgi:hypothetical protein